MIHKYVRSFIFFNDTATTEIYTLSLHDALPISRFSMDRCSTIRATVPLPPEPWPASLRPPVPYRNPPAQRSNHRSEEHTSELQSRQYLVCRLLLEKKKKTQSHLLLIHFLFILLP